MSEELSAEFGLVAPTPDSPLMQSGPMSMAVARSYFTMTLPSRVEALFMWLTGERIDDKAPEWAEELIRDGIVSDILMFKGTPDRLIYDALRAKGYLPEDELPLEMVATLDRPSKIQDRLREGREEKPSA